MRQFALAATVVSAAFIDLVAAPAAETSGSYTLTAHSYTAKSYPPTFTGNGLLGVRVPPAGEGYANGTVPSQSELAGCCAKPTKPATPSDAVQERANIPTWSTLLFDDAKQTYSIERGTVSGWAQVTDGEHPSPGPGLKLAPTRARSVRLRLPTASMKPITGTKNDANPPSTMPILDELTVQ